MKALQILAWMLIPAIVSANTSTTQSPEANFLRLSASADEAIDRAISTVFSCASRRYGYYADVSNDCRVFHICDPTINVNQESQTLQFGFFCPKGMIFAQEKLICDHSSAIACKDSERYYHINELLGIVDAKMPPIFSNVPIKQQAAISTDPQSQGSRGVNRMASGSTMSRMNGQMIDSESAHNSRASSSSSSFAYSGSAAASSSASTASTSSTYMGQQVQPAQPGSASSAIHLNSEQTFAVLKPYNGHVIRMG